MTEQMNTISINAAQQAILLAGLRALQGEAVRSGGTLDGLGELLDDVPAEMLTSDAIGGFAEAFNCGDLDAEIETMLPDGDYTMADSELWVECNTVSVWLRDCGDHISIDVCPLGNELETLDTLSVRFDHGLEGDEND